MKWVILFPVEGVFSSFMRSMIRIVYQSNFVQLFKVVDDSIAMSLCCHWSWYYLDLFFQFPIFFMFFILFFYKYVLVSDAICLKFVLFGGYNFLYLFSSTSSQP